MEFRKYFNPNVILIASFIIIVLFQLLSPAKFNFNLMIKNARAGNPELASITDSIASASIDENFVADSSWWSRKITNNAFGVGERLKFSVKYGIMPAGSAIIEIPEIIDFQNHRCFKVVSTAETNDVVSVFYKVRDRAETNIDSLGIFTRRFWKHLREGGYKMDQITIFDQRNHLAIIDADTIPTYAFVQDVLSSLYYLRTQNLEIGRPILIDNHTDKKNYPLQVNILRKENIEVPAGKFDCFVVEPVMRAEGIFRAKGRIWVWLSDDNYKLPVQMKTEVFFLGSISAQLNSYQLGNIEVQAE